ncbi:right-handed parallel beta-helix repeat-containing protein [Paenibacillus sp. CC-CFT747]|nr:right-handed parallel beta-helix repeat-containing protein [Paenibacillus sp. CC-CFT747]
MRLKARNVFSLMMSAALVMSAGLVPAPVAKAAGNTYYVATGGDDSGPGTSTSSPFKTIDKCAQVMQPGDTCVIASGTYRETVTPANKGTAAAPITFQAAPGATVIVSGTETVNGWSPYNGNIYAADLPWDLGKENQLFVRTDTSVTPLWEARWPNISQYSLPGLRAGTATADSGSGTTLVDSDLPGGADFWKGGTIWERGGYGYVAMGSKITGYDNTTHTLTYNPIAGNFSDLYPIKGSTYFVSGVLGALDAPNEWYVDADAHKVYLWAPDGGVPTNVEVKKRKTAFNLNGKDYIHITGIQTFAANITMSGSNYNVLDSINAQYIYFSNFSQSTSNFDQLNGGISISGHDNEIKNSTIANSSGTLVNIDGSNNRIVNNVIHDGSYFASYDPLVKLSSGSGNLISRNEIRGSGRFNLYWRSGSGEISYNDISEGMWLSRDGAMIYSWGTDMGNSNVHHNLIHDSKGTDMSVGLYFDNFSQNVVAHHNVIYNNDVGIQVNTPGNYRLIYNNTVVNNGLSSIGYWGSAPYANELYGSRVYNNIFTNAVGLTADTASGFNTTSAAGLNFVNASAGNFRLKAGSTAINTGAVIPGITNGYVGPAPDTGAYEYGGADWTAGPDLTQIPGPYVPVDTPYMNLLKNSGFGSDLLNWLKWTTDGTTVSVPVGATNANVPAWQKRGYSDKLKLGPKGAGVEQKITGLKPDTEYKFVAWVYNEPGEAINLGVFNYGGTAIDITSKDEQYVRKEITFKTGPTNTDARVRIYKNGSAAGISYADDAGVFELTPFSSGVSQTLLKDVSLSTTSNTYKVGDQGTLTLKGTQQDGKPADLTKADVQFTSSDPAVLRIDQVSSAVAAFTALSAGQVTVTATASMDGISKGVTQMLTVFPTSSETGTEWTVRNYGPAGRGFTTANSDGTLNFIGMGSNVWDKADDFAFLSKEIQLADPNTKVTMTATIDSLGANDPASVGLMFRDKDTADSHHVHFRVDGSGKVLRYVFRSDESILDALKPVAQQKYWGSQTGLLLDFGGKSITAPFQMQLVKEGNKVTGYYFNEGQWVSIGSTTVEFSSNTFLAGIGMYAGAGKPPVKAVISKLEVKVDRELAKIDASADQTLLGAAGTAAISVSGTMTDGSQADLSQTAITYTSDNNQVVTVDGSGKVTAVGEGTATVTVSVSAGGKTFSSRVGFTVDATAPTTIAAVTGQSGKNGWYTSAATVSLSASDHLSGVAATEYRIGDNGSWTPYTGPVTFSDEGITRIQFRSVDKAGNIEAAQTVEIPIDKTAPALNVQLDKTSIWPANHKMVTVNAALNASDSASGVDSVILTSITSDDAAMKEDDIQAAIGTAAASFSLRAEKDRIYTITYTATDKAGNSTTSSVTVTVPHDQSGK